MILGRTESDMHLQSGEWLSRHTPQLNRNLPRLVNALSHLKDPTGLNLVEREVSETRACHLTRSLERVYGAPEGYQVCTDGKLIQFDTATGEHLKTISPHIYFYGLDSLGNMHVLDLFASQAFFPDTESVRGIGNKRLYDLSKNASHLITQLGNGIVAVHGKVDEIQQILGLEHLTYEGFLGKYSDPGPIRIVTRIPNMFTGLSDQQNGLRR